MENQTSKQSTDKISSNLLPKGSKHDTSTLFSFTLGSVALQTHNLAKTVEQTDENSRRKIDRSYKTGAILSQDHLIADTLRNGGTEESIYSSFEEESIER